jgi:class 3 adenylate cyclase
MPRLQRKSFASPDEIRTFPLGQIHVIRLEDVTIGRFMMQPGWSWSGQVKPIVRTQSCQLRHLGYVMSGTLKVTMDDGTVLVIERGDGYQIPPGHDAEIVGAEPFDAVEFSSAHTFGLSPEELGERVLATVLFSDVVGSTAMLSKLGDRAGTSLLQEHNARIREAIDRYRGREIDTAGDGFLAIFDGAARAVRAAALMDPAVEPLGIRVRVGLHTSEVEFVGGKPRGVGIAAAARVAALAGPGEVLVSGTTRDLLDGSGLVLEPRGEHELKGISGPRAIFALQR